MNKYFKIVIVLVVVLAGVLWWQSSGLINQTSDYPNHLTAGWFSRAVSFFSVSLWGNNQSDRAAAKNKEACDAKYNQDYWEICSPKPESEQHCCSLYLGCRYLVCTGNESRHCFEEYNDDCGPEIDVESSRCEEIHQADWVYCQGLDDPERSECMETADCRYDQCMGDHPGPCF